MALDTLQIPATIINNDKLVSMYGSLLAKKKSEQDAYQKGLIEQMAKIDSTGIKREDIDDYSKMYESYVKFGTDNLKNLSDPNTQVKLKQMENQLKGFITLSKANKEEDIKLVSYMSPDYDDNTRQSAQQFITMPTLKRTGAFDYTKTSKIDKEDYISKWKIDPKEIIVKGNVKYTNPVDAYPSILQNIEENVSAKINTLDGAKALAQHAIKVGLDLANPEEKQKAIKSLSQTLFDINKVNFDKAVIDFGAQDKITLDERSSAAGYDVKKEGLYQARTERLYNFYKGNPNTIKSIMQNFPGATYSDNAGGFKITIPAYKDRAGNDVPARDFQIDRTKGPANFMSEANRLFEILGEKKGYRDIDGEELDAYLKNPKNSKYLKQGDMNTFYKKTTSAPATGGSLLGGGVKITKPK